MTRNCRRLVNRNGELLLAVRWRYCFGEMQFASRWYQQSTGLVVTTSGVVLMRLTSSA
jgi:hypothetical protein